MDVGKADKKAKIKKKPMKVVYISNPRKFKTSASEFRALVQELTGQDAEVPDPAGIVDTHDGVGGHPTVPAASKAAVAADDDHALDAPIVDPNGEQQPERLDVVGPLEFFGEDDVFLPPMFENLSVINPSSLFFESATHVDVLRSI
uniref:Sigma factor binding protein 1ic-like n=1 Tax=Rhizophora mucronata TaxID=61149 RepID=A0A2P2JM49_RHIMU